MVKAFVGAGGKTTLIRQEAKKYLEQGCRVFVTTSTHMYIEENTLLTDRADEIIDELKKKHYAMAGIADGIKIRALSRKTYEKVCAFADVVLVEADGSKHMPLKFPNDSEPVIYDNVDEIIVVYGLHALGKKACEVVHRLSLSKKIYPLEDNTQITEEHMRHMVQKAYVEPLKKKYPQKTVTVRPYLYMNNLKIGCVIMASGLSRRFGKNKLLEEYQGKTFLQRVLELTGEDLFIRRVVVTRSLEVKEICEQQNVPVVFHWFPDRNDTVRLGIETMEGMDGCMFCPCDQPLLRKESLAWMLAVFLTEPSGMVRLSYKGKQGTPVLFGKEYFQELSHLPQKAGGSFLVKKYPEKVRLAEAEDEWELFDVDTVDDLINLNKRRTECLQ